MHLASEAIQSSQWDLKSGTSSDIHPYALVESFLLQDELRRRLDAPFIGTPYTIGSVSVEKVLIDDVSIVLKDYEVGFGRVPYGASVELVKR